MARTLRLRTLGGLAVEGELPPALGAATQRRPLALLALLALARDRGVSRDKLLAYLWPESSAEKARHLLNQALYSLRRDLTADELFLGSSELRLNPTVLPVDAREFEDAVDRGDAERAGALYAGPFLDGFFLSGAPEFEHWVETERARLARRAERALETLAGTATARGNHPAAVDWWRRLTALDPLSSRFAIGLMEALAAAGDRAGALRHARVHEQLVAQEPETSPDGRVAALVQRLRAEAGSLRSGEPGAVPRGASGRRLFAPALADRYTIGRTLPVVQADGLASGVAEALDSAHAHNVVHRNIKREHILLDAGHAVVGGFGIVRALEAAQEDHLTVEGLRVGTPPYMSPEQMAGLARDGRSDLYRLASAPYEPWRAAPPPRPAQPPPI